MKMTFKEYVHNREHSAMGCGSMENCALCGPDSETPSDNKIDLKKIIYVAMLTSIISGVVSELVVKRLIFKKKD